MTNTVSVEEADDPQPVSLSDEERRWLRELPINLALEKIKKGHWDQRCITCQGWIGNHSIKKMKKCVQTQWKKEHDAGLQS